MAGGGGEPLPPSSGLHLVSAFLAMEPTNTLLSHARLCGGGSVTESVQRFIWDHCIREAVGKCHAPYLKNFLKKLIYEIESNHAVVLDEFYELLTDYLTTSKDESSYNRNFRALKYVSFLFPEGCYGLQSCPISRKLVVPLQCSLNMLEGDTGCSIWPSSLFLSEVILSYPQLFTNKSCFEVGSGVGLVGVCLAHVKAYKVILSDGDLSTLANMKLNLKLNHISLNDDQEPEQLESPSPVQCMYLPWESAAETDLVTFKPDIILGADIIYDPSCLPDLVRVLSALLHQEEPGRRCRDQSSPRPDHPQAYIASVIRNAETFDRFLGLVESANLAIEDITQTLRPFNLLPYVQSYDRSSIRLFVLSVRSNESTSTDHC